MAVLSKADILNGATVQREFHVPQWGGSVLIKPISDGEYMLALAAVNRGKTMVIPDIEGKTEDEIKEILQSGSNTKLDFEQLAISNYESTALVAKYGLVEEFTLEEIKNLKPAGVVATIAKEVLKISGIGKEGEEFLDNFRKDTECTGDISTP